MVSTLASSPSLAVPEALPPAAGERAPTSVLLATRIAPPRLRPADIIARGPLHDKLERVLDVTLSLVTAPAGYGKSTALGEWYLGLGARGICAAWLTVDDIDNDPIVFAGHLVATIEHNIPPLRGRLHGVIEYRLDVDLRITAIALINAIEALGQPVVLIIDDLHEVTNPNVLEVIGLLANSGSRFLHLAISSRSKPKIRMAKLRTLGETAEFSAQDLQFDRAEVRRFLVQSAGDDLDDEVVNQVFLQTEGWIVGLKLAALSFQQAQRPHLPQMTSAASLGVDEFLRDEVLARLPGDVAEFVLDAAIVGEFSVELCDAILERHDSAQMIDELEARQLFISRVGQPGWFRFHQLFCDAVIALGARAKPRRKAQLHHRAADWFEQRGFAGRAVRHAFATGNLETAAKILARVSLTLVQSGRGATLVRYGSSLPKDLFDRYPALQLDQVYSLTLSWQFGEASRLLRDVRANLTNSERIAQWHSDGLDMDQVLRKQVYCEMQLAILRDEMVAAEALARQWLAMDGTYTAYEDAVTQTSLIYAQREQFDCRSLAASSRARATFVNSGHRWGSIWHDCITGAGYTQIGNLARASTIFEGALATAIEVVGRTNPTTAMPALHLSEVLYEFGDIDGAKALVDEFLPLAGQTGIVDKLVAGYQTRVRLAALESLPAAIRALDEGAEIAMARDFERLNAVLVADRIHLLASAGESAEVRRIGALNNLTGDLERFAPTKGMTTAAAARAYAAAQVAQIENDLGAAESLLGRWVRYLGDHGCVRLAVRFSLLLAHVQIVTGEAKSAHRTLRTALQFGARGGFVRSFIDANQAVRAQLQQMRPSTSGSDEAVVAYHAHILQSLQGGVARVTAAPADIDELGGQYDSLNDRESELLLMISTGMMNSQIADETGLTLGTVKWYLQQIYAKLGVNRRSEATFKARQLGLIG